MRTAVPCAGGEVCARLDACEEVRFYEDDHGRVVRRSAEAAGGGFDALLDLLERRSADVVLCGEPAEDERRALAHAGLLTAAGFSGPADEALRAYLGRAIACDPDNDCNYCGHKTDCGLHGIDTPYHTGGQIG